MEGLRGFAVLLVFCVHFVDRIRAWAPSGAQSGLALDALAQVGHCGVDLFFVLSGYLIYGSLIAKPRPFGPYLARRFQRIYPTFLAVFVVYLGLFFLIPSLSKLPQDASAMARYLLLNLALLPGLFPIEPMITVAWSLSYEVFFYLAMPLLIASLRLRQWNPTYRCWLYCSLTAALVVYCAAYTGHVRLIMFLSGVLLYELLSRPGRRPGSSAVALVALLAGLGWAALRPDGSVGYALRTLGLFLAFLVLCHVCFANPRSLIARLFAVLPLRWLGNMSYSYYLVHGLALHATFMLLSRVWAPHPLTWPGVAGCWLFSFLVSLLPSALLFLTVERPLSLSGPSWGRTARRLVAPHRPGVPPSTADTL